VVSREEPRVKLNSKRQKPREKKKPLRNSRPDQTYLTLTFLHTSSNTLKQIVLKKGLKSRFNICN
jgi:hypothetical protein